MKNFVVYDNTGCIQRYGSCPDDMLALQASDGLMVMEGIGRDDAHYVLNGAIVARPQNTAQLAGMQLMIVPVPATIRINGIPYQSTDATVDLDFTYPGSYTITVAAFPYLDKTFTVTV